VVNAILARVAANFDLSVLQSRLLRVLHDREPGMAQLARLLDLDKSSTTGLVDRAELRGLVRRLDVPEDRRAFRVALTTQGHTLAASLMSEIGRQITAATEVLSDTNRNRLSSLASQIVLNDAAERGVDLSTIS
jgi:DNA-binding MarR family transcriptional regulator